MARQHDNAWLARAYADKDAADVATLHRTIPELPDITAEGFRQFAALSFNRGGGDFRLIRRGGGELVALLTSAHLDGVSPPVRHFRIAVHSAHRRRGLGTRLLGEVARQAASSEANRLTCNAPASSAAATGFLEHHRFTIARIELLMRRDCDPPPVSPPPGISLRPAEPGDDAAWIALHAHAYADQPDFSPLCPNAVPSDCEAERRSPGFTLTVAERAGEVIGLCHGLELEPGIGLINSVAVRADQRGRGVGAALLAAAVHALRDHGASGVELSVASDNQPAIAVYRRLGFVTHDRMRAWRRRIGA